MKEIKEWYVWLRHGSTYIDDFLNSCSVDDTIVLFLSITLGLKPFIIVLSS
jgi:hypothetical protein